MTPRDPQAAAGTPREDAPFLDQCPVCSSRQLQEIRCKTICLNCRTILQSCADL